VASSTRCGHARAMLSRVAPGMDAAAGVRDADQQAAGVGSQWGVPACEGRYQHQALPRGAVAAMRIDLGELSIKAQPRHASTGCVPGIEHAGPQAEVGGSRRRRHQP